MSDDGFGAEFPDGTEGDRSRSAETPFEIGLRGRLQALADHAPTRPGMGRTVEGAEVIRRHGIARRMIDQRWVMVAAAAVIVAIGGVLVRAVPPGPDVADVVAGDDGGAAESGPGNADDGGSAPPVEVDPGTGDDGDSLAPAHGGVWRPMAPSPITFNERAFAATAWTGEEAIFWAGSNLARTFAFGDGATYDPASDTWGSIPVPGWGHPGLSTTYFDHALYAAAKGQGIRLDFVNGDFEDMAPLEEMELATMVATDNGVYGIGPRSFAGEGNLDVGIARYLPDTDAWGDTVFFTGDWMIGSETFTMLVERRPVWTGTEIVIWHPSQVGQLAFDPTAESWRRLPPSTPADWPESGPPDLARSTATVADSTLVVVAADASGRGAVVGRLEDDRWLWSDDVLPTPVNDELTVAAADDWVVLISPGHPAITHHIRSGGWYEHIDGPMVTAPNTVWTGSELIVWGGGDNSTTEGRVTNLIWTPPPPVPADQAAPDHDATDQAACNAERAAERLRAGLPVLDVEPTDGPVDLQQQSQAAVRGTLLWGSPETIDRIEGTRLVVKAEARWVGEPGPAFINDLWIPSLGLETFGFETDPEMAVDVIAFVERRLPTGAWVVHPEGLWIACGPAEPALAALVRPAGSGWTKLLEARAGLDDIWASLGYPTPEGSVTAED